MLRDMLNSLKRGKHKQATILVPIIIDNDLSGNPALYFYEILDCNPDHIKSQLIRANRIPRIPNGIH
jgi:hypothetical protein